MGCWAGQSLKHQQHSMHDATAVGCSDSQQTCCWLLRSHRPELCTLMRSSLPSNSLTIVLVCHVLLSRYKWSLLQPVVAHVLQEQIYRYEADEHVEVSCVELQHTHPLTACEVWHSVQSSSTTQQRTLRLMAAALQG